MSKHSRPQQENREIRTSVQIKLKSNETLSSDVLWVCPKKTEGIWIESKRKVLQFLLKKKSLYSHFSLVFIILRVCYIIIFYEYSVK